MWCLFQLVWDPRQGAPCSADLRVGAVCDAHPGSCTRNHFGNTWVSSNPGALLGAKQWGSMDHIRSSGSIFDIPDVANSLEDGIRIQMTSNIEKWFKRIRIHFN